MFDGAEEQCFLVGEIVVDRALRDARRLADVLEARVAVATLGEYAERGIEYFVRAVVGPPLPSECFGRHAESEITYSQV